ncbi:serine/threonine protein kinase [Planctomicrobium sp.]|nr:serine/threonine protein kinase [Planctomicrobium sp.]
MNQTECLDEKELWSVLDECASEEASIHLLECVRCRKRLHELESSYDDLVQNLSTLDLEEFLFEDSRENVDRSIADVILETHPKETISRYRIIRRLSYGGQGQVYLGEDAQLNRKVAIKVAHASISEDIVSSELILAEGELLAKLNHPQLAQVYDAGVENGRPFLVMEYVEGQTLNEFLREHQLNIQEIRRMILEIAKAVNSIHESGILHLDLKPENVIVTPDRRCKVVDLGTSWLVSQIENDGKRVIGGTVAYMSPEQFHREGSEIGPWTDVFGLGALLYSLLTHANSLEQVENASQPEGLWACGSIELSQNKYPKLLTKICLKAIAEDTQDRFQTVNEFIESFEITERRRQAAYLVGTGILSLVIGLTQVIQFAPSNKSISQNQQASFKEKERIPLNEVTHEERFVQIRAVNLPAGAMHFCVWSEETGLRFLPATRELNNKGLEVLSARSLNHGVKLSAANTQLFVMIICAEFAGPVGTTHLTNVLHTQLEILNEQSQDNSERKPFLIDSEGKFVKEIQLVKQKKVRNFDFYEFDIGGEFHIPTTHSPFSG